MRTTLTLEDDVATKLRAEARRTGRPFKVVVNECLRFALVTRRSHRARKPLTIQARDLGPLKAGVGLDNIGELLENAEGPGHR